jgi:hypothetical protein
MTADQGRRRSARWRGAVDSLYFSSNLGHDRENEGRKKPGEKMPAEITRRSWNQKADGQAMGWELVQCQQVQ